MKKSAPEYRYTETYRKISFHKTNNDVWLFDDFVPDNPGSYWTRYFTNDEIELLESMFDADKVCIDLMRRAIDRAYNKTPAYTGDLRDRNLQNE